MNIFTFSAFTFIGTFVWSLILTYAGFALGENWDAVAKFLDKYQHLVIYAIAIAIIGFGAWKIIGKKPTK